MLIVELRVIAGLGAREEGGVEGENLEERSDSEEGEVAEEVRRVESRLLKLREKMWSCCSSRFKGEAKDNTSIAAPRKPLPSAGTLPLERLLSSSIALPYPSSRWTSPLFPSNSKSLGCFSSEALIRTLDSSRTSRRLLAGLSRGRGAGRDLRRREVEDGKMGEGEREGAAGVE